MLQKSMSGKERIFQEYCFIRPNRTTQLVLLGLLFEYRPVRPEANTTSIKPQIVLDIKDCGCATDLENTEANQSFAFISQYNSVKTTVNH